jgi:hypothetical protein
MSKGYRSAVAKMYRRLSVFGLVELSGMGAIVAGVWMIYEPAALVIAGIGAILWAQGNKA